MAHVKLLLCSGLSSDGREICELKELKGSHLLCQLLQQSCLVGRVGQTL